MRLIEKWKSRETKKKLREENIRLKEENKILSSIPKPAVCTVDRNVQKICAKHRITEMERGIPTEVVKHELLNKLSEHLSDFAEYDFENDRHGNTIYTAILYVATGDMRK